MTPPELMLASLGSCAAFYAVEYLRTRNLAQSGVEVRVNADKLKQPARIGNFRIHVVCPVPLTEEQTEGLMRSVKHCLIHNTLLSPPQIEIELTENGTAVLTRIATWIGGPRLLVAAIDCHERLAEGIMLNISV